MGALLPGKVPWLQDKKGNEEVTNQVCTNLET